MAEVEVRKVEIDGCDWFVLLDVLTRVGKDDALRNPMFVSRIPEAERQQVRLFSRWTWVVTEAGADAAVGLEWRQHGNPAVYNHDRAAGRAYTQHSKDLKDKPRPAECRAQKAPFRQIAEHYRQLIISGGMEPGVKMPYVPAVAMEWDLGDGCVRRSWRTLRDEGLIRYRSGRNGGYFVVGPPRASEAP
ncbi:GntR family transcriptional regulator [Streptomyces erythrochromogenes]|uniref:GntR family transcriptional regulator n=1 Tax=Streptomyces erythrochromogenes TaxID=285574 RepID=UPI003327143A